ncbi:uncharacterized protein LOC132704694 isoform X3 [Cylas formicarius]|uniref:uncharacterized protein LOC132704694 isoform X3 n=1 Tax=Cylas formicarius TaxID=197179 RepID=UPI0029588441|nr:uncharacterized protein LOC132704694 isoform X3 [Cylas formicarius]
MRQILWCSAVLVCFLATVAESKSLSKREANYASAYEHGEVHHVKRSSGFSWDRPRYKPRTTTPKGPTTTEDIVIFEPGKPVSLQVPDQLFGSSFTLVTNLSNTVGDFMINSALRAQRLLESMRPFLRGIFGAKGIVIEASTDKPIFSDPNENKID